MMILLGILVLGVIVVFIVRALSKRNKKEMPIAGFSAPSPGTGQQIKEGEYVKRCSTCRSIFTDETLAFCLSDGSTLERVAKTSISNDPNATLAYREADRNDVPPTVQYHPDMNKKG
jgi:hypothetical protein